MRKCFRFFQLIVILAVWMVNIGPAIAQEDITAVDDSGFDSRLRPEAVFYHDEHWELAGLDCIVCHHVYDDDGVLLEGETSEGYECSECHGDTDDPRNLGLVVKYHKRCKGCHEETGSGPVVCSECHVK